MLQASSDNPRERWLKALLPAGVMVAIYVLLINVSSSRELHALHRELANEQKRAVTNDELVGLQVQLFTREKESDQLAQQIDAARQAIDAALRKFGDGSATERLARVGQLCREHSILLLKQKPVDNVQMSKVREASLKTLLTLLPDESISYRQLELVGRYLDVQTLLQRLPETADGVLPLAIELLEVDPSQAGLPNNGERRWRVYLLL